jgi:hypothetical protein
VFTSSLVRDLILLDQVLIEDAGNTFRSCLEQDRSSLCGYGNRDDNGRVTFFNRCITS